MTFDDPLCRPCRDDLPWSGRARCPRCASVSPSGQTCGRCLSTPPAFDSTTALFDYRFPVNALLTRYKYHAQLPIAALAAGLMADSISPHCAPDLLLPMPLHPLRLKERGFNQSLEIARIVSRRLQIPLDGNACKRIRPTMPQAGLSLQARSKNLRGAFRCERNLSGRHVVLIDDVMTTGASLDELARAVRKAGAVRIDCWVVARTQRDRE